MTDASSRTQGMDRRTIMTAIAAVPAVAIAGCAPGSTQADQDEAKDTEQAPKRYLRHQVFFWLKNPDSLADRDRLIAGLEKLSAIEEIRELRIGIPAATEARDVVDNSFDVSEMMLFDGPEAQLAYQQHPIHEAFVSENQELWDRVVVYDSMDV